MFNRTDIFVRLPLPPKEGEPPPDGPPDLSMLRTTDRKGIDLLARRRPSSRPSAAAAKLLVLPGARVDYFRSVHQTKASSHA